MIHLKKIQGLLIYRMTWIFQRIFRITRVSNLTHSCDLGSLPQSYLLSSLMCLKVNTPSRPHCLRKYTHTQNLGTKILLLSGKIFGMENLSWAHEETTVLVYYSGFNLTFECLLFVLFSMWIWILTPLHSFNLIFLQTWSLTHLPPSFIFGRLSRKSPQKMKPLPPTMRA